MVERGKGQFRRGLYGMLGILILSRWATEGLLSSSEQRSDLTNFGILFCSILPYGAEMSRR